MTSAAGRTLPLPSFLRRYVRKSKRISPVRTGSGVRSEIAATGELFAADRQPIAYCRPGCGKRLVEGNGWQARTINRQHPGG